MAQTQTQMDMIPPFGGGAVMTAWPDEIPAIGDQIAKLTSAEANELTDYLVEVHGFKPFLGPIPCVPLIPNITLSFLR